MGRLLVSDVAKVTTKNTDRIVLIEKEQIGMKGCIKQNSDDITDLENNETEVQKRMKLVEEYTIKNGVSMEILKWVGMTIGGALIYLMISVATGKATILFN